MTQKIIFLALLLVFTLTILTGCDQEIADGMWEELKDNEEGIHEELDALWDSFLTEVNDWADAHATCSLTEDGDLVGTREAGVDDYVGSYEASYSQFTGEESIFGGTALKRREGSGLRVVYSLAIQSGKARLYRLDGSDKKILAEITDSGTYEFTVHAGKNFIVLEGEQFTGNLSLTVESVFPEIDQW